MITLLAHYERISLFHTMEPFFSPRFRRRFRITGDLRWCLERDNNKTLFMERWFKTDTPPDLDLMRRLRDTYETIVFFDGYAAAGTHGTELLPYVDHLFHKSVFSDPENYRRDLYAGRLFSQYYHDRYGIADREAQYAPPGVKTAEEAGRIRLSWNIGLGTYPRRHAPQRVGVMAARAGFPAVGRLFGNGKVSSPPDFSLPKRTIPVHARFGLLSSESVSYQRVLQRNLIREDGRFVTGSVPQDRYYAELADSKIVLSPFGWGEVCFRDFEAISAGALLLKPDMSHMKTWPDVYVPGETYVPISWDASDLLEKAEHYLGNDKERARITRNAWDRYQEQRASMEAHFESVLDSLRLP